MAGKFTRTCEACGKPGPARFRTLLDRYLCEACYRRPRGVEPSSPQATGAGQTGETVTVEATGPTPTPEDAFDLRHLKP